MGEISRLHEADIVPFAPNDATDVSNEFNNIINNGVNDNYNAGTSDIYSGSNDISVIHNANRLEDIDDLAGGGALPALTDRVAQNEADILTNVSAIALNTTFRTRAIQVLVESTVLDFSPTLAQCRENWAMRFTAVSIGANIGIFLPAVTVTDLGLTIKIYGTLGTGSFYKYVDGQNCQRALDGSGIAVGSASFATSTELSTITCTVYEGLGVSAGQYLWLRQKTVHTNGI